MKIKFIFFDMGNTLIHFHKNGPSDEDKDKIGLERMARYLSSVCAIEIKTQDLTNHFFAPWMSVFPKRNSELKEYPIEQFLDPFLSMYNKKISINEKIEALKIQSSEFQKYLWMEPEVKELLRELKASNYILGVISNSAVYDEINIDHFYYMGIEHFIDNFTFSYSLGLRKPRKEIFIHALKQLNATPEKSLMVGDSLVADISGAQSIGMKAAWYNPNGIHSREDHVPDIILKNLYEIKNYLTNN